MTAVAYIACYKAEKSVGGDPLKDFEIGKMHGVVGCGKRWTEATRKRLTWFTIINGDLYYNGPLLERLRFNPWCASGIHWYTYKVNHHFHLGKTYEVLADAGVSHSVIPKHNIRYVNDGDDIRKLIAYSQARLTAPTPPSPSPTAESDTSSKIIKYTNKINKYALLLGETENPELRSMIKHKIVKYTNRMAAFVSM